MADRPVHEYIKELSNSLVILSDKVVKNFSAAIDAISGEAAQNLEEVRLVEDEIDASEVRLEESCLVFLALNQPVARDLRSIITILKINTDLERVGDLSVHICERIAEVDQDFLRDFHFEKMGYVAKDMVQKSIQAFVNNDRKLAEEVCDMDEELDALHRAVFKKVSAEIRVGEMDSNQFITALSISRYIERIGDHATKIAREVLYLVTGEIVRHVEGSFEKLIQSLKD
ncbi:MAG: phosphate signaling complex protein PhoU [Chlorobium phaeobacteroides]|uniref:Phosphate-specific transport system accessory protein PhoU n=1 Tax=Chlorobium phaeobacteroides (strain BS1) TaxID=331678 RepID=B3EQY8_CHLPB|nr:phosphate signaling complex protein PhoU [Chlorobium phaeobacteroides]MBL6955472.1 phosphate signaling complex protein PhoU [Chlorobium phaeobacteroides]